LGKAVLLGVRFTVNRADVNDFEHICLTNREIVTGLLSGSKAQMPAA